MNQEQTIIEVLTTISANLETISSNLSGLDETLNTIHKYGVGFDV